MVSSHTVFLCIEFVLSILGIIFYSIAINQENSEAPSWGWLFLVTFVVILVYLIFITVCNWANRPILPIKAQVIFELVAGVILIIMAIFIAINARSSLWLILDIIVGFVLPPVLAITAYDKM